MWTGSGYLLSDPSGVLPVAGAPVTSGFFRTLGVAPVFGRDFHAGEDLPGAPPAVMLSLPAVAAVLAVAVLPASYIPARRVGQSDGGPLSRVAAAGSQASAGVPVLWGG